MTEKHTTDEELAHARALAEKYLTGDSVESAFNNQPTPAQAATIKRKEVTGRTKYPWALWTNGKYHEITRGEHFEMPASKFQAQLYRRAEDMDLKVKTERLPDESLGIMFGKSLPTLMKAWKAAELGRIDVGRDELGIPRTTPEEVQMTPGWYEVDED